MLPVVRVVAPRVLTVVVLIANALATFSFGSVVSQDPLPPCTSKILCNGQFCADVCIDGTVQLDTWLVRWTIIGCKYGLQHQPC